MSKLGGYLLTLDSCTVIFDVLPKGLPISTCCVYLLFHLKSLIWIRASMAWIKTAISSSSFITRSIVRFSSFRLTHSHPKNGLLSSVLSISLIEIAYKIVLNLFDNIRKLMLNCFTFIEGILSRFVIRYARNVWV